jgi:hypothetical protein
MIDSPIIETGVIKNFKDIIFIKKPYDIYKIYIEFGGISDRIDSNR